MQNYCSAASQLTQVGVIKATDWCLEKVQLAQIKPASREPQNGGWKKWFSIPGWRPLARKSHRTPSDWIPRYEGHARCYNAARWQLVGSVLLGKFWPVESRGSAVALCEQCLSFSSFLRLPALPNRIAVV